MDYQPRKLDTNQIEPRPVLEDVTVVIPTVGRPILEECLWWIAAGSAWPGGLIVVDQGRVPEVAGWIETLQSLGIDAQYVPSSQHGKAAALNRAIERVETRFLAVTDDDCFVHRDWLSAMTTHLRENPESIVTGPAEAAGDEAAVPAGISTVQAIARRPRLEYDTSLGQ